MSSGIPGQTFIPYDSSQAFDSKLPPIQQPRREVVISNYSKPVYEFCKQYITQQGKTSGGRYDTAYVVFDSDLMKGLNDNVKFYIHMSMFSSPHLSVARRYIDKHEKIYQSGSGRRSSKKRPTARRRRSSKARKARKSRSTRRR